jgi:hypothetical protein
MFDGGGGVWPSQRGPPQIQPERLWVNLRGFSRRSQAIPQRFNIFTMDSFVLQGFKHTNPL